MYFMDVFAGCGGLSLGLLQAGWKGRLAIEKSPDAFATLQKNLIHGERFSFAWPSWLPCEPHNIVTFHNKYKKEIQKEHGNITLLAGGPPCQGFSYAGRRNPNDPRNKLSEEYLEVVQLVQPRFLLMENVQGFARGFSSSADSSHVIPQADKVSYALNKIGYEVYSDIIVSSVIGVPQPRKRFVLIAIKRGDPSLRVLNGTSPFEIFFKNIHSFRHNRGLPQSGEIPVRMAIDDLETTGKNLVPCVDSDVPGFLQIEYKAPSKPSSFVSLMRKGLHDESPNSLRLPRHRPETKERFEQILLTCPRGRTLPRADKIRFGLKKQALTPLSACSLAPTVTTLPDDIIHYLEPRILTVRENARLQTFPDWFAFHGVYTTGGAARKIKCPRYTQVGNAVPPLLAEALGELILNLATEA